MTFLNPFVLAGLAAAAIPIILHLLNLRKLRTIEFSTLTFLKELQQTKIRRLKIRQILLLIIRTLLVIMIVLTFSRPAMQGSLLGTIGTNAHSTVVFILDDSFSMLASDERGERFRTATSRMEEAIGLLKDGDEAFVVRLSDLPAATVEPATHDVAALRTMTKETTVSVTTRSMEDALRLSARLLSTSKNANHEVYLFSDVQKTLFPSGAGTIAAARAVLFGPEVRFFIVDAGGKPVANVGIDSVAVRSQILEPGKPVQVAVTIGNYSDIPLRQGVVSLYLDDTRLAQTSVDASAWGTATAELTAVPPRAGHIRGRIVIEEDAISQDNQRFFSLNIPEQITLLVVADRPDAPKYPLLALLPEGDLTRSHLVVRRTEPAKFSLSDLRDVDVLLLAGLSGLDVPAAGSIGGFVQRGGGLVIFPEAEFTGASAGGGELLRQLRIPPPQGVRTSASAQTGQSFRRIDGDHPLFATVFEREGGLSGTRSVESPSVIKSLLRQTGKEGRTVIELGDGSPFLSEHRYGRGKVLFFSVASDLSWSDFPLKGIFAPLMYRSVVYVASSGRPDLFFTAGDESIVHLPVAEAGAAGGRFSLMAPDRTEERILPVSSTRSEEQTESLVFGPLRFPRTGIYALQNGPETVALIAVNPNPVESDTRTMAPGDFDNVWDRLGIDPANVKTLGPTDQVQTAVLESRFGVELWKHCLLLALLLALLEMLIARDSRKEMQQAAAAAGVV